MLPPNWGKPHAGPRRFDLAAEGLNLRERYKPLGDSDQLDEVFDIALGAGATHVYLDRPYVDFDYRSEYAHFYGRAFEPPPAATERLLFATGKDVIGVSVVRPLPQPVGRTHMPPPEEDARYVTCLCTLPVHAFGSQWDVQGYPFLSQDGEYGVCAHAAIWSIARYHHLRYRTDRYTISGIIDAAGLRERTDKTGAAQALAGYDIVRAFRGIGLPALQFDIERIPELYEDEETADSVIRRYLNSGLPVAVLTPRHMLVLIGYGEEEDGGVFYIVSDDNLGAYQRMKVLRDGRDMWISLIVPLPGRMHVNGEAAEARAEETFDDMVREKTGPRHLLSDWIGDKDPESGGVTPDGWRGNFRVKTYATLASEYVSRLAGRGVRKRIREHHIYAPKGGWVWVTEIQDPKAPADERVVGEIVIDATSRKLDPSPLFGNIDGWAYVWDPQKADPLKAKLIKGGSRHRSAIGDHSDQPLDGPPPEFAEYSGAAVE